MEKILTDWNDCRRMKLFEIPVTNKATKEATWVVFEVEIVENMLRATHETLTYREDESDLIPHKEIEIDTSLSLDENLAMLHEKCLYAIFESDYFEYREE